MYKDVHTKYNTMDAVLDLQRTENVRAVGNRSHPNIYGIDGLSDDVRGAYFGKKPR